MMSAELSSPWRSEVDYLFIQSYLGFPLFVLADLYNGLLDCAHKGLIFAPL